MSTQPDDEFGDGYSRDHDDAEARNRAASPLSEDLAEELRRIAEENKAIRVNLSLSAALSRIPNVWLEAICQANCVCPASGRRSGRAARVAALVAHLTEPVALRQCVLTLSPRARVALRCLIHSGGWMHLAELAREFGSTDGDGWSWHQRPPTSCLGELRCRGLVFIGRSSLTREGRAGRRMFKVAVVPRDLRNLLRMIFEKLPVCHEEELVLAQMASKHEQAIQEALSHLDDYYDVYNFLNWQPPLEREDAEDFVRHLSQSGFDPELAQAGVEIFLSFVTVRRHEVQSLDDFCGYHLSELVSQFVEEHYDERWSLERRRSSAQCVCWLYERLFERGRILKETRDEVRSACARLLSGKRKLNLIRRPPPLGGEPIFIRVNPNTGEEERYTFNHQRLLMVWAGAFHHDWRAMLSVCDTVPSGAQKKALIHELTALEPDICDLLLSQADAEDFYRAILWFYEDRLLELSAW
ncbi:MAG: hypothetical protein KatS3mg052_2437 [Candidatus Roseilinea sp.]|nr:MAG: hypothetical protein KatS3mg052_2437 [Candidatus Roseilinea sp.]